MFYLSVYFFFQDIKTERNSDEEDDYFQEIKEEIPDDANLDIKDVRCHF